MQALSEFVAELKSGDERFTGKGSDKRLLDFWRWAYSDLLTNAQRGIVAEFIVGSALECLPPVRLEWDAFDLKTENGIKVEVKSSSYVQSWKQRELSKPSFSIRPTIPYDYENSRWQDDSRGRQSDIYVFCLFHHTDATTLDPLNLTQWSFYVVSARQLDLVMPIQKTIGLSSLKKLCPDALAYDEIKKAVNVAYNCCYETEIDTP